MNSHRRLTGIIGLAALAALAVVPAACATLQNAIQPPEFAMANGRSSEIRLLGPSIARPLGGAEVRVWAHVRNPNAFGFTLTRLAGNVFLDQERAADVDLPLGLPLQASGDTIIPIDVAISFADVPGLADQIAGAFAGQALDYSLRGTLAVDAGPFGQPSFGPSTWLSGEVKVVR
ncbi:MAG TPA: LEA type 2 family protein [Longimicrobiales bacterium]|nr:LEA type 2 family protein [Longimicrobiales bacterium]